MKNFLREFPLGELLLAIVMIAFSLLTFWGSLDLPEPMLEPIGPAVFPIWTSVILFGFAVIMLWQAFRGSKPKKNNLSYRKRWDLAFIMVALTVLYFAVMAAGWLGFRWATVVYSFLLTTALFDFNLRKLPFFLLMGLILGIGLHYIFTEILYIDLP